MPRALNPKARHAMSDGTFYPTFDLGDFRYASARYVKLLIRARWKCQPYFLSGNDLVRWGLKHVDDDRCPAWRLLEDAAGALAMLNTEFIPRCGSGGVPITDETTPVGRLISNVCFLVDSDGGGPFHNQALLTAAVKLKQRRTVHWAKLVAWDTLPRIRDDLDKLPHPQEKGRIVGEVASSANSFQDIKVTVDIAKPRMWVGGQAYAAKDSAAASFVQGVVKAAGQWISGTELEKRYPELQGTRLDRIGHRLPVEIRRFIDGQRGKGYRWKVEERA